ncbi:uncharacterized protein LOC117341836 [Pecten maximus]|uniref:uncharacterized protein LOC117341836 n=1 Tax=Pecten maximus TaxID=6579 RepID=UPI001457EE1F|nr:uncharacterized protein LOC117341836 [Pecten maximus]
MYGSFDLQNDMFKTSPEEMNSSDDEDLGSIDLEIHAMVEIVASDEAEGIRKMIDELARAEDDVTIPAVMTSASLSTDVKPTPIENPNISSAIENQETNKKRFKTTTEIERKEIAENSQSHRTKQNTTWGMKIFQAWSMEVSGKEVDMSTITAAELDEILSRFYCEATPKNVEKRTENLPSQQAQVYHKNSLINIRGAINRKLTDLGRDIDLVRDKKFKSSNLNMTGLLKQRMHDGSSRATQHKAIINENDLKEMSTYLSSAPSSPVVLRQCTWYNIAIHFVTRGLEFHKQLRLNSFDFCSDEHGEFALLNHETQQKNYQGGISHSDAPEKRMYVTGAPN